MTNIIRFLRILGVISVVIVFSAVLFPSFSIGQEYPTKIINLVLPQPPGGTGPILGTMLAEESKKYMKQPMIIVYKVGAGGTIGASYVAHSAPDGYTLLLARPAHISAAPSVEKLDYTALDFEPMGQILSSPLTLLVRADAPWKTLAEFVDYAKKNPGMVTVGTSGAYTSVHLHGLRFEKLAGVKFTFVPFVGGPAAITALAGGHVTCVNRFPGEGEALIDAGKLRVLTVYDSKRNDYYPKVPTSGEAGYPLEAVGWGTLMGPKGMPKKIVTFWEDIIRKITHDQSFVSKADKLKMDIEFKSIEDFKKRLHAELADFSVIIKDLGLKKN
jgi:tripartite-type tricarboxylate transporter receptor subunit TctC